MVRIVFPELGDAPVEVPLSQIEARYTGYAIYARPRLRFDARSPVVKPTRQGHWFWSVIAENRQLYRDVLLAAFLTNLFAVAMPLFIMNVYDRVVPNQAFESVRDFIGSATVIAFIDLPFALIFFVVIGWIAWPMLIPLAIGTLLLLLYALAVQGRMHELAETTYRAGAQRNATLVEGLVGFETVKALGAEAPIQRKWEKSAALLARVGAQLRLLSTSATNSSAFVQQLITVTIVILGVYLIGEHALTMGG